MAKIDIDINNIFYQLHEAAVTQAKAEAPQLEFYNTGVDEESKVPSFTGSGQYFICAAAKDEKSVGPTGLDKKSAFNALEKYVEFFCGEETAKKISIDQLEPIEVGQKIKRKKPDGEDGEENVKESLLAELFEDEEDDVLEEASSEKKVIGYLLPYQANIKGEKPKPPRIGLERLGKHLKNTGHALLFKAIPSLLAAPFSLLGKALGSFGGITIKTGSGGFNTKLGLGAAGKASELAAKGIKKGGELAAKGYAQLKQNFTIDLTTIESDISRAFDKDFPNNEVNVKVYKTSTLIQILKKQGKFSKKIESKLSTGSEYCIGIIVASDDRNYDSYNKEVIANEATKGVANQNDSMFSGKITKDMVLKVARYGTKRGFKTRQIFYENIKSSSEILSDLTKLLFEKAVAKDEAIEACKKAAYLIKNCNDQAQFWNDFESDQSVSDDDLKSNSSAKFKKKSDFRAFFQDYIRTNGKDSIEDAIRERFQYSIQRSKAFLKLVTKVAAKFGVKLPADHSKKSSIDIESAKEQIRDMYIIVRKRMKYVDADEKGGKK